MAFTLAILAVSALITGGSQSPLLPLLVLPVGMMPARFRSRVVAVGAAIGAMAIVAVGVAVDAGAMVREPAMTIISLALLGNVVAIAIAIQGAELQHRSESVLDPLTGLLNRKASRTSVVSGFPVNSTGSRYRLIRRLQTAHERRSRLPRCAETSSDPRRR